MDNLNSKIEKLESIVNKMDSGVNLEEGIKLFEEGVKLTKDALDYLGKEKGKITEIKEQLDKITEEPYSDD